MYYILTYDIGNPRRLVKVLKICRRYMMWISRSVFEGELSPQKMERLLAELNAVIKPEKDSIVVFTIRTPGVCKLDIYGSTKAVRDNFIG